jgi:hypothetical protein
MARSRRTARRGTAGATFTTRPVTVWRDSGRSTRVFFAFTANPSSAAMCRTRAIR